MGRVIDAEFIEKYINREEHNTPDERWRPESEFAAMIDNAPTADAAPVVHGEWQYYSDSALIRAHYRCTNCNQARFEHYAFNEFKFCPMCGAKMDGGGNNGEEN